MNKALLAKWFRKHETKEGIWIDLLLSKYVKDKCISGIEKKPGDSQFWGSLMGVKKIYFQHVKRRLGDGKTEGFGKAGGQAPNL